MSDAKTDLPTTRSLILPTLKAVEALGGSARHTEIIDWVISSIQATDEQMAISTPTRPTTPVLINRLGWARSLAKLGGALDSPQRELFVLTTYGRSILAMPTAKAKDEIRKFLREVNRAKPGKKVAEPEEGGLPVDDEEIEDAGEIEDGDTGWTDVLLARLHRLTPAGFEGFVMYLLRTFDLELTGIGGPKDKGIDGIGLLPLNAVLSTRVAVQVKRYDPTSAVSRKEVALFRSDANEARAERAVFVTLGRFTADARDAAVASTPTVDLIDGTKLCELVREKEIGLRIVPQVQESWFDRFDPS
jgi:restriction system protein